MSDELTPAPEEEAQDTPAENAAPVDGTPATPEADTEYTPERARGLHAELTKAQQEVARLRQIDEGLRNPERAAEVLKEYGYSFGDDEPDEEDELQEGEIADPVAREWIQKQQQEETLKAFNSHLDKLAGDDLQFTDWDRRAILAESMANGFTENVTEGIVKRIKDERKAYDQSVVKRYVESKKAPHVSSVGTGATDEVLPLDATHAQRVEYILQRRGSE